jgi:hypothetical protein
LLAPFSYYTSIITNWDLLVNLGGHGINFHVLVVGFHSLFAIDHPTVDLDVFDKFKKPNAQKLTLFVKLGVCCGSLHFEVLFVKLCYIVANWDLLVNRENVAFLQQILLIF